MAENDDPLELYRKKRSAEKTLEPFGVKAADRPQLFVVQKHRARRLHYDLRLEIGGTLKSWAEQLGLDQVVRLLDATLEEEKNADQTLNALALKSLNREAV